MAIDVGSALLVLGSLAFTLLVLWYPSYNKGGIIGRIIGDLFFLFIGFAAFGLLDTTQPWGLLIVFAGIVDLVIVASSIMGGEDHHAQK